MEKKLLQEVQLELPLTIASDRMNEEDMRRAAAEPDPFEKYGVKPRCGAGTLIDMMGAAAAHAYVRDRKATEDALYEHAERRFGHTALKSQIAHQYRF